jgi:hypothetical protein
MLSTPKETTAVFDPSPITAIVDRRRLVEILDVVADAAGALESADGDPDLVRALRASIAELALDVEVAELLGTVETPTDPVRALETQLGELERRHVDEREHHHAGLADYGAAVPVTCHYCGATLRARFVGRGWIHPRTDCPFMGNPRPADRRASADVTVRLAPDHRPRATRSGGDLVVSLARPDYLSGISLDVAIPIAAAGRWALNLFSEVGQAIAEAAEEAENH